MKNSKTLLIVFHSITGGTEQMARAAARGASSEAGVETRLLRAADAGPDDALAGDGYILATPETLGSISGLMKDFFDRTYYHALDRIGGRPYLALVCAGSDGQNACRQIERIAAGWRLRKIAEPVIVITGAQIPAEIAAAKRISEGELQKCAEHGAMLAAGMSMGAY